VLPAVDVIVPCYNYGHYLQACVRSLLSQRAVDVRVLVIDDCSTDESAAVGTALARADARVTFRRHAHNQGHIQTYNEGLDWVRAPYLLLISADDLLVPGALARAAAVMDANPAVTMVHGRQIAFVDDPPAAEERSGTPNVSIVDGPRFIEQVCTLGENPVATPTVVARTAIQRRVGGYAPELPHTADLEMWLRFAACGAIAAVEAFQAYKREHASNMQHAYVRRAAGDLLERQAALTMFFERAECAIPDRGALRRRASTALAWSAFWRAATLFEAGDTAAARDLVEAAVMLDPSIRRTHEWRKMLVKRRLGPLATRWVAPVRAAIAGWRDHLKARRLPGRAAS
jgi:hypothetical protein